MRAMIERSLQIGAKVVIFTPPVTTYADTQAIIQPYLQVLRKLAPLYRGTYLVDVHQAFAEKKIYDPPSFSSLLMDPWHPTVAGHQFIADLLDLPQYQAAFRIDGTKEVTSDIHSQKPSDR